MMSDREELLRLLQLAGALVDAVTFDDSGALVAGQWMGGGGGLLSRDTIKAADATRRDIMRIEAALVAERAAGG